MVRPRSMPRYSASRLAGMGVLSAAAHDGSASASSRGAAAAATEPLLSLSTTSSAKRTRFCWLPRRAISRFFFFRFSACDAHGNELPHAHDAAPRRRRKEPRRNGRRALTGRGEARPEPRRRDSVGVGGDQLRLLVGAAQGVEDERAGERHGGGRDGEARVGAARRRRRGRRRHPAPARSRQRVVALQAAESADEGRAEGARQRNREQGSEEEYFGRSGGRRRRSLGALGRVVVGAPCRARAWVYLQSRTLLYYKGREDGHGLRLGGSVLTHLLSVTL